MTLEEGEVATFDELVEEEQRIQSKNEIPIESIKIEIPAIEITLEENVKLLGKVDKIQDVFVVIKGLANEILDYGSPIINSNRVCIGKVEETFGRVSGPMYTLQYNSPDEIKAFNISVGDEVHYISRLANYASLQTSKGSDASNIFDEEVAEAEREYSDDEEEQLAKKARSRARNNNNHSGDKSLGLGMSNGCV